MLGCSIVLWAGLDTQTKVLAEQQYNPCKHGIAVCIHEAQLLFHWLLAKNPPPSSWISHLADLVLILFPQLSWLTYSRSRNQHWGEKKATCITMIQLLGTYCFSQAALHTSIITIVNSLHSPLTLSGESVLYASPELHVDQGLVPAVESCPSGHTFSAKRTAHVGLVHGFQKAGFAESVCAGQSDRLQEYVQTDRTKTVWTFKTPRAFFNQTRVHFRHRRHSAAGLSVSINDDSLSQLLLQHMTASWKTKQQLKGWSKT